MLLTAFSTSIMTAIANTKFFRKERWQKKIHFKILDGFLIILIIEESIAKWTKNPQKYLKKRKTYIFLDIIGVSNTSKLKGEDSMLHFFILWLPE